MKTLVLVAALGLAVSAGAAFAAEEAKDFQAYVEEIRKAGMSEGAKQELLQVASIRSGATAFNLELGESGRFGMHYSAAFCPKPGTDPEEVKRMRQEIQERVDAEIAKLKTLADADGSGFVSTEEAKRVEELFFFGLKMRQAVELLGPSKEKIARGFGWRVEDLEENLRAYESFPLRGEMPLPALEEGGKPVPAGS